MALAALSFALSGCLMRSHKVERRVSEAPLLEATLPQLVDRLQTESDKIRSLNATVDIATDTGGQKKGKITEFQEIRGYVLVRKPSMLRMKGLFPVLRNTAFDMVSDGEEFKISLPTKNKFVTGTKEVKDPTKPGLENLRPQHILDALLLQAVDPNNEIAVLEQDTESVIDTKTKRKVEQPNYVVNVIRRNADGRWALNRRIFFSRDDLRVYKQLLYDANGNVETVATYDNLTETDGVSFPNLIKVERPIEEYTITLGVVKLSLNKPLRDDQFELVQPEGTQVVRLDANTPDVPAAPPKSQ